MTRHLSDTTSTNPQLAFQSSLTWRKECPAAGSLFCWDGKRFAGGITRAVSTRTSFLAFYHCCVHGGAARMRLDDEIRRVAEHRTAVRYLKATVPASFPNGALVFICNGNIQTQSRYCSAVRYN